MSPIDRPDSFSPTNDSYSVALSKLLPAPSPTTHPLLFSIYEDPYYCLLLPWTLPPTVIVLYLNWLGLEFYRTN